MERLTKVMDKYLKKAVADWDKKKVLTLTIDKQWFDMVVSGKKKEEYRIIKGYWAKRLLLLRSELEEPFKKMSKDCAKNWDSISPEMAESVN